ncbi:MAG TPA: ABC transporter permease [Acidobacteriaceae bacterium]|nr:ABC transporter permease [Acidobacteriaceae bacterium]
MRENAIPVGEAAATLHSTALGVARGPNALRTTLLMAQVTFREAARRKILWIATSAGIAFLAFFWMALHFAIRRNAPRATIVEVREGILMMTMMVLYAGSMMTSLMAVLTSCDTLSGEIASGTIHAIATKPVERWSLVLGKWIGFVGMLTLYVLLIEGGTIVLSWGESGYLAHHAVAVLSLVWLQAVVLLGVTMAAGSSLSSLTSGAVSLGLYGLAFVGGWIEQFGSLRHIPGLVDLGILASLVMPSDALWRRAAFKFQPPLLGSLGVSPFSSNVVPSNAMVVYAVLYALLALLLAQFLFSRRDL